MRFLPPGLLRREENPEVVMMIGFAGHVDHGKTRLVRLLTGCETDRLKEEKERGLSIELGFAPCRIAAEISAGIVDMPGHEQFIRNMVAGASGLDVCVLVVAADDGVMPQTLEHLQIMEFMGVRQGLVVISKTDLVTPARVETVRTQVTQLVKGTPLEKAPICPVSSETFEGFEGFYEALVEMVRAAKITREEGIFRMPIEKVFSVPGFGTVVSGIPVSGSIAVGDEAEVLPAGSPTRIRAMERFKREAARGGAGQCLAVNLARIPHEAVDRGSVLATPGYVIPCEVFEVILSCSRNAPRPLQHGEEIRLHTGTLEVQGRLKLYQDQTLSPGATAFGSLRLNQAIPACATDRFVLRLNSPLTTVAGGVILCTCPEAPRGSRANLAAKLEARWKFFSTTQGRFEYHFIAAGSKGSTLEQAAVETLLDPLSARRIVDSLLAAGTLESLGPEGRFIHTGAKAPAMEQLMGLVQQRFQANPHDLGPTLEELAQGMEVDSTVVQFMVNRLVGAGKLQRSGQQVSLPEREDRFKPTERILLKQIEELLQQTGFATPRPEELPALLNAPETTVESLLDYLRESGKIVRIGKNVVFHASWVQEAARRVSATIQQQGSLDSAEFKNTIQSSRKYALALLDYFDSIGMTQRLGNKRILHPAYLRTLTTL